jgi:hypothetical protein
MRRRIVLGAGLLALLLFLGWFFLRPVFLRSTGAGTNPHPAVSGKNPAETAPEYSPLADQLLDPALPAAQDLEVLLGLLGQFTTVLRLTERPPLGDNADITAALLGRNRRRLVVIPPHHPAVQNGVLVDRWGTPFHFHARSAEAFDVRSAGPDRRLFTNDDLIRSPASALPKNP